MSVHRVCGCLLSYEARATGGFPLNKVPAQPMKKPQSYVSLSQYLKVVRGLPDVLFQSLLEVSQGVSPVNTALDVWSESRQYTD